jgi:focal adhesion kinase 1
MADFSHVQSIATILPSGSNSPLNRKCSVQIRVAGSPDLLVITCPSLSVAENLADLVDGYCRLVNNSSTSIWTRKGKKNYKNFYFNNQFV